MPFDILYIGFVLGHGGDAHQMLELAAGMQRRGKRVKIAVPCLPTTELFASLCAKRGVEVERTQLILADPINPPSQNPDLLAALFTQNPASLYHLHTGDVCLSRSVPGVPARLGIDPSRIVVTVHGAYDTLTPGDARANAWSAAARDLIGSITTPSLHALNTQLSYGVLRERLIHIANGIDVTRFGNGNASKVRLELGLQEEEILIVFASRLDSQKRPLDALQAFIKISGELPFAHLAFVGDGALEPEITHNIQSADLENRIHMAGHRSDVADWLAAADVWMLPTESENFSLAVLEAMAAGCPMLTTLCRGNDEVLVEGRNALIHAIGDVDEMVSKLHTLLTDAELRSALGRNAKADVQEYSLDGMVEQYAQLYAEL